MLKRYDPNGTVRRLNMRQARMEHEAREKRFMRFVWTIIFLVGTVALIGMIAQGM